MQGSRPRTQAERTDATRTALIAAARHLFVTRGFAATGTPEIVAAAGVTRGALYHHFADKTALFDAVVMAEAEAVADRIRAGDFAGLPPQAALILGGEAFLAAMQVPGRTRLLLVEAPAVLGPDRLAAIDAATGGATLAEGLRALLPADCPAEPMAALLSAAYDRAALALAQGADPEVWRRALARLIGGLTAPEPP